MLISKYKKTLLIISIVTTIISIGLVLDLGLSFSIDFVGGTVIKYELNIDAIEGINVEEEVRNVLTEKDVSAESISISDTNLTIKTKFIEVTKGDEITNALNERVGASQVSFETVGSVIGQETIKKSAIAVFAALGGILLYISYAFRNIQKPYSSFKFAVSAILAMVHDVFIVLGIFSLLGYFMHVEIDVLFITALLTVIGFSVHDSIVVFDRIRENIKKLRKKRKTFPEVVDVSILETLRRSVFTSLTVLIILASLFIFGGESIKYFVLALIVGIASGTYSSIFVASPILAFLERKK